MDCYDPQARIGLVCDEWGTWWKAEDGTNPAFLYQQNALRDALVASLHFDIFHKHARRLTMANIAQTVNVLQAMVLTDGAQMILTPTYHVFEMNKAHQDATNLPLHVVQPGQRRTADGREFETVSASASIKDGQILVSATNLALEGDARIDLDLRGTTWTLGEGRILTAPSVQAHNTADDPTAVAPKKFDGADRDGNTLVIEVPAHSFVTVQLSVD
nr:alpha-L-arabinofuranosidase C-terminal domain-containing protein [Phytoactinopolyspora mesophila]